MKDRTRVILSCLVIGLCGYLVAHRLLRSGPAPAGSGPTQELDLEPILADGRPKLAALLAQLNPEAQSEAREQSLVRSFHDDPFAWDDEGEPYEETRTTAEASVATDAAHSEPEVRLTATLCSPRSMLAVLDGRIMKVGDSLECADETYEIAAIRNGVVELSCVHQRFTVLPAPSTGTVGFSGEVPDGDPASLPPDEP